MKKTDNYDLNLPSYNDTADISVLNENFEILDTKTASLADLKALEVEVQTLKDATLNNMTNNVFLETFASLESIKLIKGIYDPIVRKVYV